MATDPRPADDLPDRPAQPAGDPPLFLDSGEADEGQPFAFAPEPIPVEPSDVWDLLPAVEPADLPPVGDDPEAVDLNALPGGPGDSGSLWTDAVTNRPPASSILSQQPPASSILRAGPGSDVIRGLFPGAGPESHLFDPGHTPTPSGVPADPGERTDSIPQSELFYTAGGSGIFGGMPTTDRLGTEAGDRPPPAADSGMIELPDPGPGGSSAQRRAVEQLFAELEAAPNPPAQVRGRPQTGGGVDPAGPDFNETDPTQSGSNLFADPSAPDLALPGGSEVVTAAGHDMMNSYAGPQSGLLVGPASSIFTRDDPDGVRGGRVDHAANRGVVEDPDATDAFPMTDAPAPSSLVGDDTPKSPLHDMLASGIHRRSDLAESDAGQVSFDMSDGPASQIVRAEMSGAIDWTTPPEMADDDQRTPNLSDEENRPISVADLGLEDEAVVLPDPTGESDRLPSSGRVVVAQQPTAEPAGGDRGRSGDRVGGALVGLLTGVAASVAAYFGGFVPPTDGPAKPVPFAAVSPGQPAAPTDGKTLLAAGDHAAAVKALDVHPADAPADIRAARGQARFFAHLREMASADAAKPADAVALTKAEADLSAAVGGTDPKAAVAAALHLGLLKEVTGDTTGAAKVYADAAQKFPGSKPVFDAALNRLRAMAGGPAPAAGAKLPPGKADDLIRAALFAVILLQAPAAAEPPAPAAGGDEPGFAFWQAVNDAAAGKYTEAIAGIAEARKLHDKRRLQFLGRDGVNPTSDPLDQIFLRCCDDLTAYWTLKRDLYGHPKLGDVVKANGVGKALDQFAAADAAAKKAVADMKDLEAANKDMTGVLQDIRGKLSDARHERLKVDDDLAAATRRAAEADAKQKTADAALAAVTAELKANGLLTDGDGPAKLPAAIKAAVSSADAKKAAEALAVAKKDAEAARAAAKAAADAAAQAADAHKAMVAKLTANAERAKADLDAAAKKAADELAAVKKATADDVAAAKQTAAAEAAERERDLRAKLAAALAAREQDLASQAARHDQTVATLRSGGRVLASAGEQAARDRAAKAFADGVQLYQAGRLTEAEAWLGTATRDDGNDARYWYFLGLAQWARGNPASSYAFQKGAELESRGLPPASRIGAALERVQGPARQALAAYRP